MIITIHGEPVAKGRPRHTRNGHTYTPKKTRDYEALVKKHIKLQGGKIIEGPVVVRIGVYRSIPKSWSKKKKKQAISGEIVPVTRPDIDNYIKAALDASNGLLFQDDNQVVDLVTKKRYSKMPYLEIEVESYARKN